MDLATNKALHHSWVEVDACTIRAGLDRVKIAFTVYKWNRDSKWTWIIYGFRRSLLAVGRTRIIWMPLQYWYNCLARLGVLCCADMPTGLLSSGYIFSQNPVHLRWQRENRLSHSKFNSAPDVSSPLQTFFHKVLPQLGSTCFLQ